MWCFKLYENNYTLGKKGSATLMHLIFRNLFLFGELQIKTYQDEKGIWKGITIFRQCDIKLRTK